MRDAGACVKGVFDPLADGVVLAVGAVQVGLMQDTGAVPRPRGDLGARASGIQPQRQGGVPQVIGTAGQRGGGQAGAERGLARGVPGAALDRLAEHATAGAAEQPPVRRDPERMQVLTEHAGQDGRRGRDEFRRVHPLHAFRPLEVQEMREGIGAERQQTELHPAGETRSVAGSPAATATARPRLPS
jgi:hypothetical protein